MALAVGMAALPLAVQKVGGVRRQKQVSGVHARGIVARMADQKVAGFVLAKVPEREPLRLLDEVADFEVAVAFPVPSPGPNPTVAVGAIPGRLVDLLHEPAFDAAMASVRMGVVIVDPAVRAGAAVRHRVASQSDI